MSNVLSKVTAALLAALLLFLFPTLQAAEREEDIRYLSAYQAMVQFADAVRNKGYLSPAMYEDFIRELEAGGNLYDVELEHRRKKYHPEYGDPANPGTFLNDYSVVYDAFYTDDILRGLYPAAGTAPPAHGQVLYPLQVGDFFTVTATGRSRSALDVVSEFLYGGDAGKERPAVLSYGGMVLNEDY